MYYSGQTLKHKETNKLVRILANDTLMGRLTTSRFIDEKGRIFLDEVHNYIPIINEFGYTISTPPNAGEYINQELKKYSVSKTQLLKLRQKSFNEVYNSILKRMDFLNFVTENHLYSPIFRKWFIKKVKAKTLYKLVRIDADNDYVFNCNEKTWVLQRNTCFLHEIKLNKKF